MSFLQTEDLCKTYPNGIEAVKSLCLSINKGEVYGLIGPNGAGKTTTIRILMGILAPTEGSVVFDGEEGLNLSRVGYLPEGANFYPYMTVEEYLLWACNLYEVTSCERRVEESLDSVELRNLGNRKLDELSRGQKQRVGIAQALAHNPDLLLLDEPTSGLDPMGKKKILSIIQGLASREKTVLISSHILPELSQVCTGVGIIKAGELILQGPMSDLRRKFTTSKVEVGFESLAGGVIDKLKTLDFIRDVDQIDGEGLRYLLRVEKEERAKQVLLRTILDTGSVITYYNLAQVSLEDIFMQTMGDDST